MVERRLGIDDSVMDDSVINYDNEPKSFYEYLLRLAGEIPGIYETASGHRVLSDLPDAVLVPVCVPLKNHEGAIAGWSVTIVINEPATSPVAIGEIEEIIERKTQKDYGLSIAQRTYRVHLHKEDDSRSDSETNTDTNTITVELEFRPTTPTQNPEK